MQDTPRANRVHIAIYGRRNVGKSSLINAITGQQIALVSEIPGTTTDPVYKAMELYPLGPVLFIDTAGLDDDSELGELRVKKSRDVMEKVDLAVLALTPDLSDLSFEEKWYKEFRQRRIPVIGVINRIDQYEDDDIVASVDNQTIIDMQALEKSLPISFVKVSARYGINIDKLKELIIDSAPKNANNITLLEGLVKQNDIVILVAPQNLQAPMGRLILPQVQAIRDILDYHALAYIVTDDELEQALSSLNKQPDLVITDSQVFEKVNKVIPKDIPLVSFSILLARQKGDLKTLVSGAMVIDELKPGDKVLIAEACSHHPLKDDIGREKIPKWLEEKAGGHLEISFSAGSDFPDDLKEYKLVVHCGSCMLNRTEVLNRIAKAVGNGVPITNYGVAIAHLHGILERVLKNMKL